ncbi:MAG: hypothetical protein HKP62_04845 [Sulfurovum sp.]|nr:hypothetical protein [Sulfurovum sp.]NNJ45324.1 hypothetical protein [Sulfurovum sp.]
MAVYNNIDSLQHELNKLSPEIRKTVEIQKRGAQHLACSVHTDNKEKLEKLLPSYQKVFPDAFISAYQTTEINTTHTNTVKKTEANKTEANRTISQAPKNNTVKTVEIKKSPPLIKQKIVYKPYSRKIINPTKNDISLYDRFHQKTLYLCAYGKDTWSPNVLIHVAFFDKEVIFTPIMGDVSPRREIYTIDNNKLYISQQGLFDSEIWKTVDSITSDYYLISSWVNNTKVNTIRYYFDLEKAEAYVASLEIIR